MSIQSKNKTGSNPFNIVARYRKYLYDIGPHLSTFVGSNRINATLVVIIIEGSFVNKIDLQALYFRGTYCHKTGTRPPNYVTPWQPTIYVVLATLITLWKVSYVKLV